LSSAGICSVWETGISDLEISLEAMIVKKTPDPAGYELRD
jgi:hypothetical protein